MVLVGLAVLAAFAALHWYVWRRLVRDTTTPGSLARRVGTVVVVAAPVVMVAALVTERAGAPFWLQRVLAWPGFLWMALFLYLVLALVVGEAVRLLLRRWVERGAVVSEGGPSERGPSERGLSERGSSERVSSVGAVSREGHSGEAPSEVPLSEGPRAERPRSGEVPSAMPLSEGPRAERPRSGEVPSAMPRSEGPRAERPRSGEVPSATALSEGPRAERPRSEEPLSATPPSQGPPTGKPAPRPAPSRRLFVSRVIGGSAAAVAAGTVGYGAYSVLRGPKVKRVTVPLAKLPRAAHGFRIAVVSDIHLGPILGRNFTRRVVDTINATQPDLIAVVGDLVDGSVEDLRPAAAPLAGLRARHGAFFVTGNHEYFSGADQWVEHVRELGLRPLRNARTELPWFDLAGVDDVAGESEGKGPDFAEALGDRDRSRASVLLAHQPVVIHDAVEHGVDLQLSGHTHGGQLWPGNFIADLANPTLAGLERYGDTQLYVTRGAGAWGPPVRVGAPSDITVVELASRRA
ncbi:membrane protein [Streptomyces formicae]|uniref:Membrane protein n=1 Tax=Streptomyces formicae TaxID=1616117 RepID=A0A291QE40_9ACTN|nr:membrane protein [Streptomyces formicae]